MIDELLRELTGIYGPSGREDNIRKYIEEQIKEHVDTIYVDPLGNLVAIRRGSDPGLMVAAHMDELGLMVTQIDDNGFLRIGRVGGVAPHLLVGQRFVFANGTCGTVHHEKIDQLKEIDWSRIYMDIGCSGKEESEKKVSVGDVSVYDQEFRDLGERYLGKSLDDRAGCSVLIETIKKLPRELPRQVAFVFTVQEELGLRGARTAAYGLEPSYAVAVDVTRVGDTPKAPVMDVSLGKGPAVKIKDSSLISHAKVREVMFQLAESHDIPCQREVLERGGTDAGAIQLSREGVPSGVLSIPCRYVHTPSEMVDREDMEKSQQLLELLCLHSWE